MEKLSKRFIASVLAVMTVLLTVVAGFSGTAYADVSTLVDISVARMPAKTVYYVGETLDTTGMVLLETHNDGKTQGVTSGITCTPERLDTVGEQVITVSYSGFTCTFTVMVHEKSEEITTVAPTTAKPTTAIYTTAASAVATTAKPAATTTKAPVTTKPATTKPAVPTTRPNINNEYILIVNAKKNELNYGQGTAVEAVVTPDIKGNLYIVWSSSDSSVATVNQKGFVTACGEGDVIITATLVDENGRAVIDPYGDEVSESVVIKCTMTIWQKIVQFFRNLFGGLFF